MTVWTTLGFLAFALASVPMIADYYFARHHVSDLGGLCRMFGQRAPWQTRLIRAGPAKSNRPTRGLLIFVARLTDRQYKRIFSLCHYFAIMKQLQRMNLETGTKRNGKIERQERTSRQHERRFTAMGANRRGTRRLQKASTKLIQLGVGVSIKVLN